MPYIETNDGVPLYYQEAGSGNTIFLIHGGSCNSNFWQKQMSGLSPRFHVVAIDLRGHGSSGKTDEGHTMSQYARDVHYLLETLGLERVVMVGWSMGGAVAFSYIQRFGSEHLAGLVNLDQRPNMWSSEQELRATLQAISTRKLHSHKERIRVFLSGPQPEEVINRMAYEQMLTPASVYRASQEDVRRVDFRPMLHEIQVPTLIFTSAKGMVSKETARLMADSIPDAKISFFENGAHLMFWEEPERFNRELGEFVDRVMA